MSRFGSSTTGKGPSHRLGVKVGGHLEPAVEDVIVPRVSLKWCGLIQGFFRGGKGGGKG